MSSKRGMSSKLGMSRERMRLAGWIALLAVVALWMVLADDPHSRRVLTLAGISGLLVIGYQAIFGLAGRLSLAQGAFFGLGAYAAAILATRYDVDSLLTLPAAMLLPMAAALIAGLPVLRLKSHYLALATLALPSWCIWRRSIGRR